MPRGNEYCVDDRVVKDIVLVGNAQLKLKFLSHALGGGAAVREHRFANNFRIVAWKVRQQVALSIAAGSNEGQADFAGSPRIRGDSNRVCGNGLLLRVLQKNTQKWFGAPHDEFVCPRRLVQKKS